METAGTLADARSHLSRAGFDLIIADLHLPDSPGFPTLETLARITDRLIIVVTGDDDPSLQERALKQANTFRSLRAGEERFRSLVELSADFYWESDPEHRITQTTRGTQHGLPSPGGGQVGKTRWDLPYTYPDDAGWAAHRSLLDRREPFRDFEMGRIDPDGVERHLSISGEPVFSDRGEYLGYRGVGAVLDDYRTSRPIGKKYAHRATDYPAGSSSPMKLVNPPVALMFHEGAPRLLEAGVHVPALADGDRARVALEAYPGLLARKQLRIRESYKSDARSEHTPGRKAVRKRILQALKAGKPLDVKLNLPRRLEREILWDGSGDLLDALICATQAAWAARRPNYGLPAEGLRGEGWIVSASAPKSSNLGSTVTPS